MSTKMFLSTYDNKIDDKNRASIPVSFRSIIEKTGNSLVYAYPSLMNPCIEICTAERMEMLETHIESFDIFSQEKDILATSILSACECLNIDAKGRVMLSMKLLDFAIIKKEITFVGKGKIFEIWSKDIFLTYFDKARNIAKKNNLFTAKADYKSC